MVTHLITILFLYQRNRPEGGWITGQNMLEVILHKSTSINLKCICWSLINFIHGKDEF